MFDFLKPKPKKGRRVMVIGLDCAAPELMFDQWRKDLPTLDRLISGGIYGELKSATPAITVPAWSSMTSSKDPGTLGIYGFRNRADYSYHNQVIANGDSVKEKRVWEILGEAGKQVILHGIPQTYPPRPVNGVLAACFLTPSIEGGFTYPAALGEDILKVAPRYDVDVRNFRTPDKDWLIRQIWDMTDQHFTAIEHLLDTQPWDFFMSVEIGVDRVHHGLWAYMDPLHHRHEPGNPYQGKIHEYYQIIDARIARMLERVDDDTVIMVVSDHGAKRMDGGICINEWLWRNGYLALKETPVEKFDENGRRILTPFTKVEVDWENTVAWGDGGYYGRLFLNVQGREPQGKVARADYEKVRDELSEAFRAITDEQGMALDTRVYKPQEIYQKVRNVAPDLIVYWDNLGWRSVGSFGHGGWITRENDTGPDDANHAENGLFILYDPRNPGGGQQIIGRQLMDVAPTILELYGQPVPADMQGKRLWA